jgi:hypothetical protein
MLKRYRAGTAAQQAETGGHLLGKRKRGKGVENRNDEKKGIEEQRAVYPTRRPF